MINKQRLVFVSWWALLLSGVVGLASTHLSATETIFAGVPLYNVMKTEDSTLLLSSTEVNAFAPIALPCPASVGANGCTFRVTVSSGFNVLQAAALIRVAISGAGALGPTGLLAASEDTGGGFEVHTMQWVKKDIPAGSSPTITVTLSDVLNAPGGVAVAWNRTVSIDVFTGLL